MFESIGVAVHGRSFQRRAEMENLALEYPKPLGGMFNLGLLHTSLTGAEGHDPYAPCTPAQLAEKHYDYWALGHIHQRGEHGLADAAPVVFSGNLQGRHIREAGEKGCVLLNIDASGRCERVFHPLDVVRWQRCTIDVTNMSHTDEVVDAFQSWLADNIARADQRLLVTRVQLVGATSLHTRFHRQRGQLQAALRATSVSHGADRVWLEKVRVKTTAQQQPATAVELEGPLESLTAVIDELKTDPNLKTIIEDELRSLIKKLPSEVEGSDISLDVDDPNWIEQLIESASAEIQGRLQTPEVRA